MSRGRGQVLRLLCEVCSYIHQSGLCKTNWIGRWHRIQGFPILVPGVSELQGKHIGEDKSGTLGASCGDQRS